MDFFEQIEKQLTDAGKNVAQQTKNFTDITQLNNAISEKRKRISQLFHDLGQQYYQEHKDDQDTEYSDMIREIGALYCEIEQNQDKIKQIKGFGKCRQCGADIPPNTAFCSSCGAKVEPAGNDNNVGQSFCPACGAAVALDDLFCQNCGAKLEKNG